MDGGRGACAWQHLRKDGKDFTSDYWHISLNKQTKKKGHYIIVNRLNLLKPVILFDL